MKLQNVHLRVNDAATGQPTPCRLRVTDADGNYYAPLGRLTQFATGPNQDVGGNVHIGVRSHAYIDGACEIPVPPGKLLFEISRGPEYQPLTHEIVLAPGKLAVRLVLHRTTDLRTHGWYSGDTRVHFISPHAALLEAQAEDVHVVNLLATLTEIDGPFARRYPAIPHIVAFSGQKPALAAGDHLVAVNTHNTHPELGSLALLHCHRAVYPLSFGGPNGQDDWTFDDWCDQCHRKNGLVVWTHTSHESKEGFVGEPLANLIAGKVDAFEVTYFEDSPFDVLGLWYTLLDAGLRVPLVGASGKDSNGVALGRMRTYARLTPGASFAYGTWIEAVRAGRTFITNGPLLLFSANEQDPGATLHLSPGGVVRLRTLVQGSVPWDVVEILHNGQVVAATRDVTAPLEVEVPVPEGGWLAARCSGQTQVPDRPAYQRVFAHTSPIYVKMDGAEPRYSRHALQRLLSQLDLMETWATQAARCDTDKQRAQLLAVFQRARAILEQRGR